MKVINEAFEIHEHLNQKLFGKDNLLKPEVREKLIEATSYFEKYIEVPLDVCDVQIVGSNASYNYTKHSDLDVHIIANYDNGRADGDTLKALYNAKNSEFNKAHDINIYGIPVEFYIQDVRSSVTSNGIYSICDNNWVKEPKLIKSATKHNTEKEVEKWKEIIKKAISSNDYDTIMQTINTLYLIRHNSIAVEGEYGKGNQLFKDIRNNGYLQRLKDAAKLTMSKELSLESFSSGELVNIINE